MGAQIPGVIGDVDAMWLKSELGWDIDSVDAQQIGAGIGVSSALYRLKLRGANCPSSVVVKLPALDDSSRRNNRLNQAIFQIWPLAGVMNSQFGRFEC